MERGMRTIIFGALTIALLTPSIAADLQAPAPAWPSSFAVTSWSGCHLGGNAGGFWDDSTRWTVETPGGAFFGESLGEHAVGSWLAGVQAGCDYQLAGGFVAGLEGGYDFAHGEGSHDSAHEFGVAYHSEIKGLASATGRIGYAWGSFLGYVKGGAAWQRDSYSASTILLGTAYTASETRPGWAIGLGGEYAFTNLLSAFVEYDYYEFGARSVALTPEVVGLGPASVGIRETGSTLRAGLNLRLGLFPQQ
jgi:outer membrane immunogenic protein